MLGRLLNETATRNGNRCFSRRPFVLEKTFKRHQRIGLEKYSKNFILYTRTSFFDRKKKSKIHKARREREKEVDFFIYLAEKFDL